MTRVLVTGGAGFIGSNVAAAFLRSGDRVVVLDRLLRPGAGHNLAWLRAIGDDRLEVARVDVRDAAGVADVVGAVRPALVVHLAAQPAVTTSVARPREDLETNLVGTFNVLEALRALAEPPPLVYTSTNKVYGALARRGTVEAATRHRFADAAADAHGISEDEPLDLHSPYGCSKGAADQYVRDYARIYGLRTVVFRMSCIYGPRQFGNEDQGWLAHFLITLALGGELAIYGDGKQVRDLLHVDDLVRAMRAAHERIDSVAGRIFNIGGGPANSVSVWAELRPEIERLAGPVPEPRREARRPGDQPVYVSDTRAAARDLGWAPSIGARDGLERLWRWVAAARDEIASARGRETVPA